MLRAFFAIVLGMWVSTAHADPLTFTQGTNFGVAVAPDGNQIVFDLQGTLWVMPIAGG